MAEGLAINSGAWIRILFCRRQYKTKNISLSIKPKISSPKQKHEATKSIGRPEWKCSEGSCRSATFPRGTHQKKRLSHTSFSPYLVLFWGRGWCHWGAVIAHAEAEEGQSSGRIIRESFPSFLQGSTNIFGTNFSAGHWEGQTFFLTKRCDTHQAGIQGAGKTSTSGTVPQPCRLTCSCGLCHPVQHLLHNQNEEIVLRTWSTNQDLPSWCYHQIQWCALPLISQNLLCVLWSHRLAGQHHQLSPASAGSVTSTLQLQLNRGLSAPFLGLPDHREGEWSAEGRLWAHAVSFENPSCLVQIPLTFL